MRIALPVGHGVVSSSLSLCEGFQFYEDDHGKIIRQFFVENPSGGLSSSADVVERYGIDALVVGALGEAEQSEVASRGIAVFSGFSGSAQIAALRFLSGTVTRDPSNTCNACSVNEHCSMDCDSCRIHTEEK